MVYFIDNALLTGREVVGDLQDIYYNNRDIRVMLQLLATSSGVAPAICLFSIFDKVTLTIYRNDPRQRIVYFRTLKKP